MAVSLQSENEDFLKIISTNSQNVNTTAETPFASSNNQIVNTTAETPPKEDIIVQLRKQLEESGLKCTTNAIDPLLNIYFECWDSDDRKSFGSHDQHDTLIHKTR